MKSELELELTKFVKDIKDKEDYIFCTNRKLSLEEVREALEFIKNYK
ncbi:MAG: hypothetical protein ACRDDY_04215 [Clostridium sp.]